MTSETLTPASDSLLAISEESRVLAAARDRRFQAGLGCALFLHVAVLVGAIKLPVRHIGDESGAEKALSVEIVSAADLDSKTTAPADPPSPPPAMAQPPPQPSILPKESLPPEAAAPAPEPEKSDPAATVAEALKGTKPDLLSIEPGAGKPDAKQLTGKDAAKPAPKTAERVKSDKAQPKDQRPSEPTKLARAEPSKPLDTTIPQSSLTGRSASFVRPPGITRSGLNDQFARNVIRALQQTMPRLDDTFGRSTIRILLDVNGNIDKVELVVPGKNPTIAQSVVFAARQTSFPIPPGGSTLADRTFLITYIYE